jgi:sensor c-di-GMP phosphodiesterase-like protein
VKLNVFFRSFFGRALSVVVSAAVLVGLGHVVFTATTDLQNTIRIREITQQTLRRAERSADYALITLSDVISSGHDRCDDASLEHIRRAAYLRGVVKDVRIIDAKGETLCTGLTHSEATQTELFDLNSGIAARNGNVHLHQMGAQNSGLVGVSWKIRPTQTLLAILNVDSLMFDVFPRSLRDSAAAGLYLGDEQFAQYFPPSIRIQDDDGWLKFSASSGRFPISARLAISPQAFSEWNREAEPYALGAAGLFGALLGYFIALAASRDRDPASELRKGLRRREFTADIQPIFELDGQRIVGGEALARWKKADGTVLPPAEFIGLAEDSGLIAPITWQIMEAVLSKLSDLLIINPGISIGFNIAPNHLVLEGFADEFSSLVTAYGVKPSQITIEITERQDFDDVAEAGAIIQRLREMGFTISLDDTGTGHNGLSYMQKLGIDVIKVDKHFVDLVGEDRVATKIIEMLVQLARGLNMSTVAEGIESPDQLKALRRLGIDKGQGYVVSRPLPPDGFIRFVMAQSRLDIKRNAA